jgi:hypothetical protein
VFLLVDILVGLMFKGFTNMTRLEKLYLFNNTNIFNSDLPILPNLKVFITYQPL